MGFLQNFLEIYFGYPPKHYILLLKFPELFSGTQMINLLTNAMLQEDKKKPLKISLIENSFETL